MLMNARISLLALLGLCLSATQAAFGAEPIRVGATVSLSGQYASLGEDQLRGMQMWAHDLNARGALLGRKVELVTYDDGSDPQKSARLYERLITQDKVDLLLGPYSSELTLAASSVAERHHFPMVATGAASSEIWSRGYRNIFEVDAPARRYMYLPLEFAKQKGLARIALVFAADAFPREVAAGARAKAAELGMEIVFEAEYDKDDREFSDLVRGMVRARPEVVIGASYLEDSIALVREAKAQDLSPKMMVFTVGPALKEFGNTLGPDAEGAKGVVAWFRSGRRPGGYDFSYRYKRRYGHNASVYVAYGYGAGQVLEAAVRLAGSLDKDKIRERLLTMTFQSLLGRYHVDENGEQIAKRTYVMQWQSGDRLLVLPEDYADSPLQYPFRPWFER
jgi:branched-chain amino acid transport system substrate-binding protein